ncbi:MAG: gamma-glutamyltransferase [Fidelibacterota bacterium]
MILLVAGVLFISCVPILQDWWYGDVGTVVSAHPIATKIGMEILRNGGNAVDAAVAVGFAMGVVDQFHSGIGGGGFIVMRLADGTIHTLDGRETAPAAAARDMYLREGQFDPSLSQEGVLAVAVPGIVAAYTEALELAGTKTLTEVIALSIPLARNGFVLDEPYARALQRNVDKLRNDTASAAIYLHKDGSPLAAGEILRQPDLAVTYEKIASGGADYFYRGEFTEQLTAYMETNGGLITEADMAGYTVRHREPIVGNYRNYEIIGMAPPSSGGVHVLQILNMLEASGVLEGKSGWDSESVYLTARFMSRAFEDRATYLGDSDFYKIPTTRLASQEYADSLVMAITEETSPKVPTSGANKFEWSSRSTTNFCVVDRWGNAVAVNQTVNLQFGAKLTLPGTGVILNDEMDDFAAQPGVPNAFGLVGGEANSIAPGKRPLSSMSPTIIVQDSKPVLILGGAGGSRIITAVLQMIVNVIDFGMTVREAQEQPRFHHQYQPNILFMEPGFATVLMNQQKNRGFEVVESGNLGRVQLIAWNEKAQRYEARPDPRFRLGG